jgi:hypothetical protein
LCSTYVSMALADHWKHDGLNPSHPITQWRRQTRSEQIKNYFHVAPPDAELVDKVTKKRLWHAKMNPVLDQLRKSSKALRMPSSHVTVDEAMIRCTGRSIDTYKIIHCVFCDIFTRSSACSVPGHLSTPDSPARSRDRLP